MSLDIPIGAGNELDRPVLEKQLYDQHLAMAIQATLVGRREDEQAVSPAFDTLTPKQQIAALTAMVRQQGGAALQLPGPPPAPEGTSRADARALRDTATIEFLQTTAREGTTVKDDELAALGQARAVSIQRALLTDTGLEPSRVFLTREGKVSTEGGKVRFELGLK